MSRRARLLLAFALFALASLVRADALHLLAPSSGATLRGGSFAELRWSGDRLPPNAEEWEAFLSIDGGAYYAFRVTPHLEIDLQSFTFIVPNVDTHNARILIRVGNEKIETHYETSAVFSIARDANGEQLVRQLLHLGGGESAREGDPRVVSWTEGARDGSGLVQCTSSPVPPRTCRRLATIGHEESEIESPAASCADAPCIATTRLSARGSHARKIEAVPLSVDLLLVCRRRNI